MIAFSRSSTLRKEPRRIRLLVNSPNQRSTRFSQLELVGARTFSSYCSFAYSALACFRMGMSGSAFFQRVRKSL